MRGPWNCLALFSITVYAFSARVRVWYTIYNTIVSVHSPHSDSTLFSRPVPRSDSRSYRVLQSAAKANNGQRWSNYSPSGLPFGRCVLPTDCSLSERVISTLTFFLALPTEHSLNLKQTSRTERWNVKFVGCGQCLVFAFFPINVTTFEIFLTF